MVFVRVKGLEVLKFKEFRGFEIVEFRGYLKGGGMGLFFNVLRIVMSKSIYLFYVVYNWK